MNHDLVHISGYLYKMTRDGRWQKRWFETNGNFLTYYKSKKMTKLLAALNLPQVGNIENVEEGRTMESVEINDGSLFTIELNERVYTLKADSAMEARRWVQALNTLKCGGQGDADGNSNGNGNSSLADLDKSQRGGCMPCFSICGR